MEPPTRNRLLLVFPMKLDSRLGAVGSVWLKFKLDTLLFSDALSFKFPLESALSSTSSWTVVAIREVGSLLCCSVD